MKYRYKQKRSSLLLVTQIQVDPADNPVTTEALKSFFHFCRVLLHNELELTASKASLEYMKAEMAELTNSRNERQRAKELLLMKHKKIEDFEKLAVRFLLLFYLKGAPHYFV